MAWQPKTEAQRAVYGSQKTGSNIGQQFGGGVRQGLDVYGQGLGAAGQGMDFYQQRLAGEGPSLAQQQMQQGLGQAYGQGLGMMAQARGGNIASAQRQAGLAQAGMAQQAAIQGGQLRAQEMSDAASQLGQMGLQQAGLGQQQNLANLGMMNDAYMNQAQIDLEYQLGQRELQEMERNNRFNRILGGLNLGRQWAGDIANSITGGMKMSDERAKEGIKPGGLAASQAVGELDPKTFGYKPGLGPYGMQVGVMAQDLERTPAGNQLVQTGPDGFKRVDVGGAAMLGLAASADQERRLRALEGGQPMASGIGAGVSIRPGNSATGLGQAYQQPGSDYERAPGLSPMSARDRGVGPGASVQSQGFGDPGGVVSSSEWDIGGDLQQVGTFNPLQRRRISAGLAGGMRRTA